MNRLLIHITSLLLVASILVNCVAPFFAQPKSASSTFTVIDACDPFVPMESREQKNELLKFFRNRLTFRHQCSEVPVLQYFRYPDRVVKKVYMPVNVPPPKADA